MKKTVLNCVTLLILSIFVLNPVTISAQTINSTQVTPVTKYVAPSGTMGTPVQVGTNPTGTMVHPAPILVSTHKLTIITGKVVTVGNNSIQIIQNGAPHTIVFSLSGPYAVRVKSRYNKPITISEIQVGDTISSSGTPSTSNPTILTANLVKVTTPHFYIGTIQQFTHATVNGVANQDGWGMLTGLRTIMLVTVDKRTTYSNRLGNTISRSDLKVGDHIIVSGSLPWQGSTGAITPTIFAHVQDLSIP